MKITPDLFEAFLKCATKCWLRATGETASGNAYAEWVKEHTERYRATETDRLLAQTSPAESALSPPAEHLKVAKWRLAVDDGVPWNNNYAEHAIKSSALLRRVVAGVTTEKGIRKYLVLLSVCQTCKDMGVDFLDLLLSRENDIHAFAESRRRRGRRSPGSEPQEPPAHTPAGE